MADDEIYKCLFNLINCDKFIEKKIWESTPYPELLDEGVDIVFFSVKTPSNFKNKVGLDLITPLVRVNW